MDFKVVKLFLIILLISAFNCFSLDAVSIRRYPTDLFENDYCGLDPSVYRGKCKKIDKCINLLIEKKEIEICSFGESGNGDDSLVCCSRHDFYKSRKHNRDGVLNYDYCVQNYKHLRQTVSGAMQNFAVNGVEVEPYEFSSIAAIGWLQWSDFSVAWNCAGNLITESFVMSAAHCMKIDGRSPNVVRLGDVDLKSPFDDSFIQQFGIFSTHVHPNYVQEANENDIALIRLRGRVL